MITLNITNNSGVAIVAGDGVLPRIFSWIDLANGANKNVVIQVGDLLKVENQHTGFTVGDLLQQLRQRGKLAYTMADAGDSLSNGSVTDNAIAVATV